MKKLLTLFFLLFTVLAYSQKTVVGLVVKEIGPAHRFTFIKDVLPKLNENEEMEFRLVDSDTYQDLKVDYLMNLTVTTIIDEFDFYDYSKKEQKTVTDKAGKKNTVTKNVWHYGVNVKLTNQIVARYMDIKSRQFLDGFVCSTNMTKGVADKAVHGIDKMNPTLKEIRKGKILARHEDVLNQSRDALYAAYFKGVVTTILDATSQLVFEPAYISEIVKEKKEKAIKVKIKGSKYTNFGGLKPALYIDGQFAGQPAYEILGIPIIYSGYQKDGIVRLESGKKKVYAAIKSGKKVQVVAKEKAYKFGPKATSDEDVLVTTIVGGDENSLQFAFDKLFYNHSLSILPNVKVIEFEDIPDQGYSMQAEDFSNPASSEKLSSINYVFVPNKGKNDVIRVEAGLVKGEIVLDRKIEKMSTAEQLKTGKKLLKKIFGDRREKGIAIAVTMSKALDFSSEIIEVLEEKKGKAKQVLIKTMVPLGSWAKYTVYNENGDEIGEVRTDAEDGTNVYFKAKVKDGGKKIMAAISKGEKVILKHSKSGLMSTPDWQVPVINYQVKL